MAILNRVRELRKQASLTQAQLADAAQTNQQQIQRVESGAQLPNLKLAKRISTVLGMPVEVLFSVPGPPCGPKCGTAESSVGASMGIEASEAMWILNFHLRGGAEGMFRIAHSEKERLNEILWCPQDDYILFDSDTYRVALNAAHLVTCQMLADSAYPIPLPPLGERNAAFLYLVGASKPIEVRIRPDTFDFQAEEGYEGDYKSFNQLAINELQSERKPGTRIALVGERRDEELFVLVSDIALLAIPLECCEPELRASVLEGITEEGDAALR